MKRKKTKSFTISRDLLDQLGDLPRTVLPNYSKLVEKLLRQWLKQYNKKS